MRVFLIGYPGDMGGANTEAWHTVKLWKYAGLDVHLIPTWECDTKWRTQLDALGCVTHLTSPERLGDVHGLPGSPTISFCNHHFIDNAHRFREMGCPLIWVNCMTFLFDIEKTCFAKHGLPDAMIYQSQFQRQQIEPELGALGDRQTRNRVIRGAFDIEEWPFVPRPHSKDESFVVGRIARPDLDKWSSNTWQIYSRIQYANKRALMMGVDERTLQKLGPVPTWADCLKPMAIPVQKYYSSLHCLLPINGGARENWPRAGLEAMATGVPIVAQNQWGWREMIEHGVTGFLGDCDEELAHYTASLAYDEVLRLRIAKSARERLEQEFANRDTLAAEWVRLFEELR